MQINRSNAGTLIAGTLLILAGVAALAGRLFNISAWGFLWPFVVIGFGALFFVVMLTGGKQMAAFAIPASIISGIGLVLLLQNITGHWESMSYFWTLIILFVGFGIYLMGLYGGEQNQKHAGLRLMKVGFILFVIFGVFFELLFSSFNNLVFPVLLILLGVYILLNRSGVLSGRKSQVDQPSDASSDASIPPAS